MQYLSREKNVRLVPNPYNINECFHLLLSSQNQGAITLEINSFKSLG